MGSRSSVVVDTPDSVIVRVDHGVADSFSRSVLPASTRGWRRARHCSVRTTHRVPELAPNWTVKGAKCVSFIAFGPSFAVAQTALDTYIASVQEVATANV